VAATTLTVGEGFITAFNFSQTDDPTQTISQMIKIGINETIPSGVSITFPATDSSGTWMLASSSGAYNSALNTINPTTPAVYYRLAVTSNQIALESVKFLGVTVTITATSFPTYAPGSFTAYATLALLDADLPTSVAIPRYALDKVSGAFFSIQAAAVNTVLLVPYATTEIGYDTGLAIANTTKDPGAAAMGLGAGASGAVAQTGKIKFWFYDRNGGTPYTLDTSLQAGDTSATGLIAQNAWVPLTTTGTLESGKSYAVMLSQLLKAAGAPADFHGYIIIVTDFTNAHGQYFLSNWSNFSNGSLMLVITTTRTAVPEANNM
jgi:hypothetical protein